MKKKMKIVLAYSGGLDTSVLVSWLKERYNADIVTFSADVGQDCMLFEAGHVGIHKCFCPLNIFCIHLQERYIRQIICLIGYNNISILFKT